MTCKHDERFKGVFNAKNGCLACEVEYLKTKRERELGEERNDALEEAAIVALRSWSANIALEIRQLKTFRKEKK